MKTAKTFEDDKIDAAQLFAQTMIVLDDEAIQSDVEIPIDNLTKLSRPQRGSKPDIPAVKPKGSISSDSQAGNLLDARTLIEESLNLGIVCSVLRAKKEAGLKNKVINASKNVDIVSLDWEIENDGGLLATEIIVGIVKSDLKRNGRIRLISIYTSTRNRTKILEDVKKALNTHSSDNYRVDGDCVAYDLKHGIGSGLRIICLYKNRGVRKITTAQKPYEVSEKELPARLLEEFSILSQGLLGNVAMATIASVRDVTHHVLKTFESQMDGPYFHHRATIENPLEAEEYAIDLVLSEVKKSVIRKNIKMLANSEAIKRCIERKLPKTGNKLTYRTSGKTPKDVEVEFTNDQVHKVISKGVDVFVSENLNAGITNFKKESKNKVGSAISTIFETNIEDAKHQLLKFASLTQLGHRPTGHRVVLEDVGATLTNGSILLSPDRKRYLICLQAVCDTVRKQGASPFIFAKLRVIDELNRRPVFIVSSVKEAGFTMLEVDEKAYTNLDYVNFAPSSESEMVHARKSRGRAGLYFQDADGQFYRWLGNVKSKRSIRAVHSVAQEMSRIGFDEFEPFRV